MNLPLLINILGVPLFGILLFIYRYSDRSFFFGCLVAMLMLNIAALGLRFWYSFCKRKCLDKKLKEVRPK
jgi:hypothetical protein